MLANVNLSYLAGLLFIANLSRDINIELLFYLKCTRSSTPTINPHIKRTTESFLAISPPSRLFHSLIYMVSASKLSLYYQDYRQNSSSFNHSTWSGGNEEMRKWHVGTCFYKPMRRWERQDLQRDLRQKYDVGAREQCGCNN